MNTGWRATMDSNGLWMLWSEGRQSGSVAFLPHVTNPSARVAQIVESLNALDAAEHEATRRRFDECGWSSAAEYDERFILVRRVVREQPQHVQDAVAAKWQTLGFRRFPLTVDEFESWERVVEATIAHELTASPDPEVAA